MQYLTTTLLTGASSGIGLEMARLLAARKHRLVLVSRKGDKLEVIANQLRQQYGVEVFTYAIDLAWLQAAENLFAFSEEKNLQIDVLVNNAGFGMLQEHVEVSPDRLQQMLQLNVIAVAELCRIYGAQMKRRRRGVILNVASTAAFQPTPYFAAYGASKSFVLNLSEALAKELEDFGVRVCCLAPGPTDTAFFDEIPAQRVAGDHLLQKSGRTDVRAVALAGVELIERGGKIRVVGLANRIMIFGNRLAPRSIVASISKRLLKPSDSKSSSAA